MLKDTASKTNVKINLTKFTVGCILAAFLLYMAGFIFFFQVNPFVGLKVKLAKNSERKVRNFMARKKEYMSQVQPTVYRFTTFVEKLKSHSN